MFWSREEKAQAPTQHDLQLLSGQTQVRHSCTMQTRHWHGQTEMNCLKFPIYYTLIYSRNNNKKQNHWISFLNQSWRTFPSSLLGECPTFNIMEALNCLLQCVSLWATSVHNVCLFHPRAQSQISLHTSNLPSNNSTGSHHHYLLHNVLL